MPRIPAYEQQALASSLVGTPGVDTSGQKLGASVSAAFEGVGKQVLTSAYQNQVLLVQRQNQQRALDKAQEQMLDGIEVADHSAKWDLEMDDLRNKVKSARMVEPDGAPSEFSTQAREALDSYLEGIANPRVRAQVKKGAMQSINTRANEMSGWVFTQRTSNAQGKIASTLSGYINAAGNYSSAQEVGKAWGEVDKLSAGILASYGTEQGLALVRETKKDIAKQYINGLIIRDDSGVLVENSLKSKAFDSVLDADEKRTLLDRAYSLQKARERDIEERDRLDSIDRRVQMSDVVANTNPNDPTAIADSLTVIDTQLAEAKARKGKKASLGEVDHLVAQKNALQRMQENVGKKANEKERDDWNAVYNSDAGAKAREDLVRQSAELTQMFTKKSGASDSQKRQALEKFHNAYVKAQTSKYLDRYQQNGTLSAYNKQYFSRRAELEGKRTNIWEGLQDRFSGPMQMIEQGWRQINSYPAPAGKTKVQANSDGVSTYAFELDKQLELFHQKYGAEATPTPKQMSIMQNFASQKAKAAHDAK